MLMTDSPRAFTLVETNAAATAIMASKTMNLANIFSHVVEVTNSKSTQRNKEGKENFVQFHTLRSRG